MLNWTHVAAATLKALFSLVCFLTWVNDTAEEVTSKSFSATPVVQLGPNHLAPKRPLRAKVFRDSFFLP